MRFATLRLAWLPALALAAACGGNSGATPGDAGGDAAPDAGADSVATDADQDTPASPSCAAASAALAVMLHATQNAKCTVVVRLDFKSLAVLGYQAVCGPAATVTDAQARATAAADTGYGASAASAPALNPDSPADEFVFYQPPSDFGGAGVVSARTGLTVFGGGVVFGGHGDISYPKTWRPAAELASGCLPAEGIPSAHGYSIGAPVTPATIAAAVDAVAHTAVPAAIWRAGQVNDAVALGYARTVGLSTATGATAGEEWIVLVNGQ